MNRITLTGIALCLFIWAVPTSAKETDEISKEHLVTLSPKELNRSLQERISVDHESLKLEYLGEALQVSSLESEFEWTGIPKNLTTGTRMFTLRSLTPWGEKRSYRLKFRVGKVFGSTQNGLKQGSLLRKGDETVAEANFPTLKLRWNTKVLQNGNPGDSVLILGRNKRTKIPAKVMENGEVKVEVDEF